MGVKHQKMGAEKTQARDRVESIVDRLGGFCSCFPPTFPKLKTVQEPQQTLFFWTVKQTKNKEVRVKG